MRIQEFQVTPFGVNCYVIDDAGEALVIDPGDAPPELMRAVKDLNVRAIINTHGHCDHCGGNAELVKQTGAPLLIHSGDAPLLASLPEQGRMFGIPFPESPEPGRFLTHGDAVEAGAVSLKVLHTPGHSPGHIALLGEGVVFCGDVLFAGSVGRTDLPGGSQEQLLSSIRDHLLCLPDETKVYCGHGPATTIGAERGSNPFLAGL